MLEKLTEGGLSIGAHHAQVEFFCAYRIDDGFTQRKSKQPVVIAMLGLVGSGKSSVANELAPLIGATVVNADVIRVFLRKNSEPYKYVRQIAENAAVVILARGGNVVLDSDMADEKKRVSLRLKVLKAGARLFFIRTSADPHVMLGRMVTAPYDEFFGGAKTNWKDGTPEQTSAVIKIGEALRRIPHHYKWVNEGGGKWVLKKRRFMSLLADIDTTEPKKWKVKVAQIAREITLGIV